MKSDSREFIPYCEKCGYLLWENESDCTCKKLVIR